MPKFGNSNTRERIELFERYIRLFGIEALDCLTADREFVGEEWIKYLNVNRICYCIRIHENFWVVQPHNGKRAKASWLFTNLPMNGCRGNHRIVYLNNHFVISQPRKERIKKESLNYKSLSHSTNRKMHSGFTKNDGRLKQHLGL